VDISSIAIDLEHRKLRIRGSDGGELEMRMPAGFLDHETNIRRVELDLRAEIMYVEIPGERATVELRPPGRDLSQLRAGRPLVYLDQNHWSTMAAARHGHRPIRQTERTAALRLAELADSGKILLPVSAGHLVETTPLHGAPRVALAGTVLTLSRGWQMRNPLHVRVEEMLRAVEGREPVADSVFAPGVDEFFGARPSPMRQEAEGDSWAEIPAGAEALVRVAQLMPAVLGLYDSVVDEESIPDPGGAAHAAAASWADGFAQLASQLREADETAEMVWKVAGGRMLTDVADDIMRVSRLAGVSPEQVIERLVGDPDPVGRMPFLAQMRQMLYARLRNTGQSWEANDLVDILFLCCASGYADVLVGERRAIGYLRQARRPAPRAQLAANLAEAAQIIETELLPEH
jgi:hypothetical protein